MVATSRHDGKQGVFRCKPVWRAPDLVRFARTDPGANGCGQHFHHFYGDTLELDELLGDRGTEASAAKAARRSLIGLGEAVEDVFLCVGRDANPGIAYRDLQPDVVVDFALG